MTGATFSLLTGALAPRASSSSPRVFSWGLLPSGWRASSLVLPPRLASAAVGLAAISLPAALGLSCLLASLAWLLRPLVASGVASGVVSCLGLSLACGRSVLDGRRARSSRVVVRRASPWSRRRLGLPWASSSLGRLGSSSCLPALSALDVSRSGLIALRPRSGSGVRGARRRARRDGRVGGSRGTTHD